MQKLKRYKNIVGKRIGGAIYFHKQYLDEMIPDAPTTVRLLLQTLEKDGYNIVKYVPNKTISLILSPDFDTADEPRISEVYTYNFARDAWRWHHYNGISLELGNVAIYHPKWLFVKDDYKGFDVEAAKRRSDYINKEMDRRGIDRSQIGNLRYWINLNI